jgi:hypothetical protein
MSWMLRSIALRTSRDAGARLPWSIHAGSTLWARSSAVSKALSTEAIFSP